MGWKHSSSGKVLAYQPQDPEFNPKYCKKKSFKGDFWICVRRRLGLSKKQDLFQGCKS
jgi:hypothetical protein